MNAVKKNNNKNEQQVIADLTQAAQQQLEASLVDFSSQLLNLQQQQLQQFATSVLSDSQKQWQQRLIEQEQAYQKLFKDWQQTKQQLDLAIPVATADNQELSKLRQQHSVISAELENANAKLNAAQQNASVQSEQLAKVQQQLAELQQSAGTDPDAEAKLQQAT